MRDLGNNVAELGQLSILSVSSHLCVYIVFKESDDARQAGLATQAAVIAKRGEDQVVIALAALMESSLLS